MYLSPSARPIERPFRIDWRRDAEHLVVVPYGELDIATEPQLARVVLDLAEGTRQLCVDLRELEFLALSSVHVLAGLREALAGDGRRLTLMTGDGPAARVLWATGLRAGFRCEDAATG